MTSEYGRPFVRQMIEEAIKALGGTSTNAGMREWILRRYPETNQNTLNTQITVCTVNSRGRVHYPQNQRPRIANRPHDLLFRVARGLFELYDPAVHGTWGIVMDEDRLDVRRMDGGARAPIPAAAESPASHPCDRSAGARARRSSKNRYEQTIDTNFRGLLSDIRRYYESSLAVSKRFGGPSEYFHAKAIEAARQDFLSESHLEYTYATLASWGMHRMGDTNCKMVGFNEFSKSIRARRDDLESMRRMALASTADADIQGLLDGPLKSLFNAISVSVSDSRLVGNSKALHHLLPDLVPPMDWQYTVRFFYYEPERFTRVTSAETRKWRQINAPKTAAVQYTMFRGMCHRVQRILTSQEFRAIQDLVLLDGPFNTSLPKIVDNMIIAYVREKAAM